MTPLHYAAQNSQNGAKTSEHLLNKASYALINWQDHKGRTALHLGFVSNNLFKCFCPKPDSNQKSGFGTCKSDKRIKC